MISLGSDQALDVLLSGLQQRCESGQTGLSSSGAFGLCMLRLPSRRLHITAQLHRCPPDITHVGGANQVMSSSHGSCLEVGQTLNALPDRKCGFAAAGGRAAERPSSLWFCRRCNIYKASVTQEDCSSAASELLSCTDWDLGLLRTALGWLYRPPLTPPAAGPLPPAGRRTGKGKRAAQQGGEQFPEDTRRRWYGNGSGRWRWPRCIRRPCRLASRHPSQSKHAPAQPTLANLSLLSSNSFCITATYLAWYLSTLHSPPGKHDQRW